MRGWIVAALLMVVVQISIVPFLGHAIWRAGVPNELDVRAPNLEPVKQNVESIQKITEEVKKDAELRIQAARTEAAETVANIRKNATETIAKTRQEILGLKEQVKSCASIKTELEYAQEQNEKMKMQMEKMNKYFDEEKRAFERKHEQIELFTNTKEENGFRPILVTVAHHPRQDLLGSFALPTVYLLSIAFRYGWALEIFPYEGSEGQETLKQVLALGPKSSKGWGSGLQDVTNRKNHNPMELNEVVYDKLGFFPEQPDPSPDESKWVDVEPLPAPGPKLDEICRNNAIPRNGFLNCLLQVPIDSEDDNTYVAQWHIEEHGGTDAFFTESFRNIIRKRFWKVNRHRLKHYSDEVDSSEYNIAMHIRRGDVPKKMKKRWTEQSVFATVARRICESHPGAIVHVFSSGKNTDGGWEEIENIGGKCGSIIFHLDEYEFDTWAHLVAADSLVISKSTFSYVPALISGGDVYFPHDYW
eukprot:CAMPEP_0195507214 /NCGR_PEP_ID=MMETSP0794_2-20130614/709_1 /TAXON_ID=515487 /ORGANISM="Stephanopyxis turris, Strain CCMP 815" /LENGTH=473 /DNA_ID=CAMNT_0040633823 /DNA_START=197 /DNA_END=1615 /DNA_ORIENTATION=-